MELLKDQVFVCFDCEATGLDANQDRIVEIACARFTFQQILDQFESLVNPEVEIPQSSIMIHHITQDMVNDKPRIQDVLGQVLDLIGNYPIVGHGVNYDIDIVASSCQRNNIATTIRQNPTIDTLRLARLYGQSPTNSLEVLRQHFNIKAEGAHRAMSDVVVNIQVFKYLSTRFKNLQQIQECLEKPIFMKTMPLGKHKGRLLKDLPLDYILWAANQSFDRDLLFSLRSEVNRRKKGNSFAQSANPFHSL